MLKFQSLRAEACAPEVTPTKKLFLVDNMSRCLPGNRGRSGAGTLVRPLQVLAALALATDDRFILRWIPLERNPADGPSSGRRPDGTYSLGEASDEDFFNAK